MSEQYPFCDYKKMFSRFKELYNQNIDGLRLIISTNWASEGYWIETDPEIFINDLDDIVYKGNEIFELEKPTV